MEVQTHNLLSIIKGSIQWVANRKSSFYQIGNNFVGLFWKITSNQDSVYDMFNSKDDMQFYSKQLKQTFEQEYPNLYLDVNYIYMVLLKLIMRCIHELHTTII
jgi:hypothetical protein